MTAPRPVRTVRTVSPSVERLVIEANRIFHDLEGAHYEEKHDEIFVADRDRWERIAQRFLGGGGPGITLLDIGTGTGFVPRTIGPLLGKDDEYILSDLSISMLACTRDRLAEAPIPCRVRFEPVDGESYPFPSKSIDAITANSVVHHIPDLARFSGELDRVLRPGGMILIGHEPNALRHRDRRLTRAARLRAQGAEIVEQVRRTEEIVDRVSSQLVERGICTTAPSREQVVRWVDFHSPTAGTEVDRTRGIDIEEVRTGWLPDYELLHFETSGHLPSGGHADRRKARARRIDGWIDRRFARRFPAAGETLCAVLRKP